MATIKERAIDYAEIAKIRGDMPYELAEKIYIEIATEQMQIDIAKAWKYIESIAEYTGLDSYYLKEEYMKAMGNDYDY